MHLKLNSTLYDQTVLLLIFSTHVLRGVHTCPTQEQWRIQWRNAKGPGPQLFGENVWPEGPKMIFSRLHHFTPGSHHIYTIGSAIGFIKLLFRAVFKWMTAVRNQNQVQILLLCFMRFSILIIIIIISTREVFLSHKISGKSVQKIDF